MPAPPLLASRLPFVDLKIFFLLHLLLPLASNKIVDQIFQQWPNSLQPHTLGEVTCTSASSAFRSISTEIPTIEASTLRYALC